MTELEQDYADQMKTREHRARGRILYLRDNKFTQWPAGWTEAQRVAFLDGWVSQWAEDNRRKQ